ncbi:MAG TPA: hypothetical protein VMV10_26145 [Pirellulales bacterium]|nr:hypothetical protein [Pirellulales bacterium]
MKTILSVFALVALYPEQGHGFRGQDARDALARTFAFLDKHLKPKAE